ncbi:MAG: PhoU domain-containing protein [Candidatus Krumholzibacteriota bacterium]
MSFRSILDLFREDNWSNDLVDMIMEMMDLGSDMFDYTIGVLVKGEPDSDPQHMLYNRDKRINKLERKIRRRVVSHLSVRGSRAEVPSALIFMNVVKDGERIGDYVKNLHEVNDMMPDGLDRKVYRDHLAAPAATITELFTQTRQAFLESDEELAGKVIKKAKAQGREYEETIRSITTSELGTQNAVCLVLVLRFFKRVVAHMSNIASTVVMPVDMIDFYDEPEN